MSLLGSIVSKILHPMGGAQAAPSTAPAPGGGSAPPTSGGSTPSAPASTGSAGGGTVDVAAVLTEMQSKSGQNLDWKHSIVDLMKLLGLDSSLSARKELAGELHYSGDTDDSATMNVWLHKQVMQKLAENGGKVPDDLKH